MINCNVNYNDESVYIEFPITDNMLFGKLSELRIPDGEKAKTDIFINEIDFDALKCFEGKSVDPDAINQLAKQLKAMTQEQVDKFNTVVEWEKLTDIYDMLNLTSNMHYYTLVKDMSDLSKVGKLHVMTREDGMAVNDIKETDFETIGKNLIESGKGNVTKHGLLFINNDLEYFEQYSKTALPSLKFYSNEVISLKMKYGDSVNYVFLPNVPMALERTAHRMGASDVSQCTCEVEYVEFNIDNSYKSNGVEFKDYKLKEILDDICKNEGVNKLNMTAQQLTRLDSKYLTHIVPLIEYSGERTSEAVIKLVECIDSFAVYGNVSNHHDLGVALINENEDYILHPDIEDYFNYEKYGETVDMEWNGKFMEGDIYVAIKDGNTLENIFHGWESENDQGIQMSGM